MSKIMILKRKLSGRAEYENLTERLLFEEKPIKEVFPWLNESGFDTGWFCAKRGDGKTFFIKKYAQDSGRNVQIRHLEKDTLQYITSQNTDIPDVIVLDDIHYLVDIMRLGQLDEEIISEQEGLFLEHRLSNE